MAVKYFAPEPDPRAHRSAQPSLFSQEQVKPTKEHRYQRGYTPQRMRNVNRALEEVGATTEGPGHLQAHFRETVARSTVPLTTFQQMHHAELHSGRADESDTLAGQTVTSTAKLGPKTSLLSVAAPGTSRVRIFHGSAHGDLSRAIRSPGGGFTSRREIFSSVVIHELGHVHQAHEDPTAVGFLSTGKKEQYADRFMVRHYRPDPREVRRGKHVDPEDMTYPGVGGVEEMPGYRGWGRQMSESFDRQVIRTRASRAPRPESVQPTLDEPDGLGRDQMLRSHRGR